MGEGTTHSAHPIARVVFDHLACGPGGWRIDPSGIERIDASLSELRGSVELVGALAALASVVDFLSSRGGGEVVPALVGVMLGFEGDLKTINASLGAEVLEKRVRATRNRAEKLLGNFALARTLDRSPAPAGTARWWSVR